MSDIPERAKYLVTKRRSDGDKSAYNVIIDGDYALVMHIQGCFQNTDHEILSIVNLKPEIRP
jgi:hypothetical protein